MTLNVAGKEEHEINGWEEPLTALQKLPFCDFQHIPPSTSAKQQE